MDFQKLLQQAKVKQKVVEKKVNLANIIYYVYSKSRVTVTYTISIRYCRATIFPFVAC